MKEQTITLSAGEWQIMEQLWQHHHLTLMELVHLLAPGTGWSKSTIVTMVGRLESKGALRYAEGGKARIYSATITRQQAALRETESLLGRIYQGSVGMLVSTLADSRGLTQDDIDELSAILEKAREGQS